MRKAVFLISPPACGKGTQVEFLKKFGFEVVSMSHELRRRGHNTEGVSNADCPKAIAALRLRFKEIPPDKHAVVDGFPRTLLQVIWLLGDGIEFLKGLNFDVRIVVLELYDEGCCKRAAGRVQKALDAGMPVRPADAPKPYKGRLKVYRKDIAVFEPYLVRTAKAEVVEHISADMPPEIIALEIANFLFPVSRSVYA